MEASYLAVFSPASALLPWLADCPGFNHRAAESEARIMRSFHIYCNTHNYCCTVTCNTVTFGSIPVVLSIAFFVRHHSSTILENCTKLLSFSNCILVNSAKTELRWLSYLLVVGWLLARPDPTYSRSSTKQNKNKPNQTKFIKLSMIHPNYPYSSKLRNFTDKIEALEHLNYSTENI